MSISLHSTNPTDQDGDLVGHDYRLSDDQYRRTIESEGSSPRPPESSFEMGFSVSSPIRKTLTRRSITA